MNTISRSSFSTSAGVIAWILSTVVITEEKENVQSRFLLSLFVLLSSGTFGERLITVVFLKTKQKNSLWSKPAYLLSSYSSAPPICFQNI